MISLCPPEILGKCVSTVFEIVTLFTVLFHYMLILCFATYCLCLETLVNFA